MNSIGPDGREGVAREEVGEPAGEGDDGTLGTLGGDGTSTLGGLGGEGGWPQEIAHAAAAISAIRSDARLWMTTNCEGSINLRTRGQRRGRFA